MFVRLPAVPGQKLWRNARVAGAAVLLVGGSVGLVSTAAGAAAGGRAHQMQTSPQPLSNADSNGHGANTRGPYDSTRDGSPAGNGNGNGQANGKPCAGCVGKADNKNPPGQLPGGADANAGYECDRNHGVGRTNPAHTGCKPTSTSSPSPTPPPPGTSSPPPSSGGPGSPPPSSPGSPPPGGGGPGTPPAAGGAAGSASQQSQHGEVVESASTQNGLASTGVPVLQMIGLALVTLTGGIGLVLAARDRRRVTTG